MIDANNIHAKEGVVAFLTHIASSSGSTGALCDLVVDIVRNALGAMVAVVVICCAQVYCSRCATCFGSTGAFCDLTTVGGRLSVLCYGIRGFGCGDLLCLSSQL